MKLITWVAVSASIGLASSLHAAESGGIVVSHYESLQRLDVSDTTDLRFDAFGRAFELRLEPNEALLSAAARSGISEDVGVYRGKLAGNQDSWVRIVVADGAPSGMIWDGDQMFAIESAGDRTGNTSGPVIYRLADAYIEPGTMSCGGSELTTNAGIAYEKLVSELNVARAAGALEEIKIGVIGDYEFTSDIGSGAADAILTRLNNVDGIFSQQLGVQITVETLETFSNPDDPFTDTLDAGELLDELSTYRNTTPAQHNQGLTHLYTGRNLDTTTVGIAYQGALCSRRFGAGLSEGRRNVTTDSLIAAHEIGHNFGAPHDGEAGSPCESETGDWIMSPSVSGVDQFSSCSITQMQDDIAAASCITALPAVDMAIGLNGQAPAALLGESTVYTFNVDNDGTLQATNVTADFSVPNNLQLDSASSSSGSCSTATASASCTLGNVAGGSGRTVTITTTPISLGPGTMTATVAADADSTPGNNQDTVQVNVQPAVDLRAFGTGTTSLTVDTSTVLRPTFENQSAVAASGVTLTVGLSSGLRADDASWPLGSCTVANSRVDCQASTFDAQSNATLSLTVTGTTTGTQNYSVSIAASEADPNGTNNSATSSVNVNAPNTGGGSGGSSSGGGSASPMLVWLLLTASVLRRSRRSRT